MATSPVENEEQTIVEENPAVALDFSQAPQNNETLSETIDDTQTLIGMGSKTKLK